MSIFIITIPLKWINDTELWLANKLTVYSIYDPQRSDTFLLWLIQLNSIGVSSHILVNMNILEESTRKFTSEVLDNLRIFVWANVRKGTIIYNEENFLLIYDHTNCCLQPRSLTRRLGVNTVAWSKERFAVAEQ